MHVAVNSSKVLRKLEFSKSSHPIFSCIRNKTFHVFWLFCFLSNHFQYPHYHCFDFLVLGTTGLFLTIKDENLISLYPLPQARTTSFYTPSSQGGYTVTLVRSSFSVHNIVTVEPFIVWYIFFSFLYKWLLSLELITIWIFLLCFLYIYIYH